MEGDASTHRHDDGSVTASDQPEIRPWGEAKFGREYCRLFMEASRKLEPDRRFSYGTAAGELLIARGRLWDSFQSLRRARKDRGQALLSFAGRISAPIHPSRYRANEDRIRAELEDSAELHDQSWQEELRDRVAAALCELDVQARLSALLDQCTVMELNEGEWRPALAPVLNDPTYRAILGEDARRYEPQPGGGAREFLLPEGERLEVWEAHEQTRSAHPSAKLNEFETGLLSEELIDQAELAAREEEVWRLSYYKELEASEIAARLGIEMGTVYAHLSTSRAKLKAACRRAL